MSESTGHENLHRHIKSINSPETSADMETQTAENLVRKSVQTVAYNHFLLESFNKDAQGQLPWLRNKAGQNGKNVDRNLVYQHVSGLLDAYDLITKPDNTDIKKKMLLDWGEKVPYLEHRVREILLPELQEKKEELQSRSEEWDLSDQRKIVRDAHNFATSLPEELRDLLQERSGLSREKVRERLARWGITAGATVASTYALDSIATIGGIGLAKIGLQDEVEAKYLLLFLAGTYGFWFKGMGANLKANWNALEQEGISTNAPSKALYELAKSRGWSERTQKILTAAGYVGTELAKELPYYVGAFGAATFFEDISDNDAIVFLAGANIGAGIYEYAAAKGTEKYLSLRRNKGKKVNRDIH